ncbi:rhomboid family intramembrane serine protease [Streptococcus uberis]|uniref:rhomboid family intramembrane serine protease n=1 Tax=Streptococcus uberis TaxID=1349 RepID=UPI0006203D35|nr:rhomboid family intramembrane serine protease [Streptococcus uberis]KKF55323.1 membrane protein [Streptococcus uberis 6780]MCK1246888.1 rhomboid family intramembrane serine protease [Streptococcus uberis]MCK1249910.1 rhomboid family intramembrane serine protease [Streptococcus uberis]MEE3738737.1 rhomboid family intramembrane serine protease [Streptococcus uberis]
MTYHLKEKPVTFFFLSVTILLFIVMQVFYGSLAKSPQIVFQFGGMFGLVVKSTPSQLWRLVTPIFIHIGWEHFLINSLTLYFVGQLAESIWGSRFFLLLYVLSGIMGNVMTLFFTPHVVAAGASTSLFGLFAAIVVVGYFGHNQHLKSIGKSYQTLIILNLVMNLFMPNVGIVGHLGGALGGALAAVFLPTLVDAELFTKKQKTSALLSYLTIALVLITLSLMI